MRNYRRVNSNGCETSASRHRSVAKTHRVPREPPSVVRRLAGRRTAQHLLSARRQLVGMSQQQTHLPKLLFAEGQTEPGHSSESNAVFRYPVGLSYRVISHIVSLKELRR